MDGIARGRLRGPAAAPATGERTEVVARVRNLVIEEILSGSLERPVDYRQEQDEWVVVLAGAAVLNVSGERVDLHSGDWVLLPAGTPHRLVETEPGTQW